MKRNGLNINVKFIKSTFVGMLILAMLLLSTGVHAGVWSQLKSIFSGTISTSKDSDVASGEEKEKTKGDILNEHLFFDRPLSNND